MADFIRSAGSGLGIGLILMLLFPNFDTAGVILCPIIVMCILELIGFTDV